MAGATIRWLGGTSTVLSLGANWVGGAVPALDDFALWDTVTTYAPSTGTFTNAVARFIVTEGAGTATSRDLGTAASPVTLSAISGYCVFGNRGNVYVTSSGTVVQASFEMPNGATGTVTGGTWTLIIGTNVKMEIGASAVMTEAQSNGTEWNVATNATAITTFTGTGIIKSASRNITTANLDGPTAKLITTGTTTVATSNIIAGAIHNHQSSGAITLASLRGKGSTLTPQGSPTDATAVTVRRYAGAILIKAVSGARLTVTNDIPVGPDATASGVIN